MALSIYTFSALLIMLCKIQLIVDSQKMVVRVQVTLQSVAVVSYSLASGVLDTQLHAHFDRACL